MHLGTCEPLRDVTERIPARLEGCAWQLVQPVSPKMLWSEYTVLLGPLA